jgi:hypothetical protein
MKEKYTVQQVIDPLTFQPKIGVTYNGKPFLVMFIEMSEQESIESIPFSKKENFEKDWRELGAVIKKHCGI